MNETAPTTDLMVSSETVESHALSRWIIIFLMFIQVTHKLSNSVVSVLLKYFRVFLAVLGHYSTVAMNVSLSLPSSLYMASRVGNELSFQRYVVSQMPQDLPCEGMSRFR